jgi:DNA-binding NarL/FixJ family response regulator
MHYLGALAGAIGIPLTDQLFRVSDWLYRDTASTWLASIFISGAVGAFVIYATVRYFIFDSPEFDERTDGAKIGLAVVGVVPGCEEAALAIAARLRSAGTPSVLVTTAAGADLDRLLSTRPHGIVCAPFTPEQFRSTLRVALARGNREMLLRRQVERSVQRAEAGEARTAQLEERLRRIADELSPFAGGRAPVPPPLPPRCQALLSRRELEVLRAFTGTGQVDLVARELGLAVATVRNHLKAIYRKMGVHSQSELIEMVHALSATPAASDS